MEGTVLIEAVERLKAWAGRLKRDIIALWIAARDERVSWYAKLLAGAVAAYALSPIDLIPDFIPILGYLDDVLIVPLGIWAVIRLIPAPLMEAFRKEAAGRDRPKSWVGMAAIVTLWVLSVALIVRASWRFLRP